MGAWGSGSFENDDAMDWVADLVDGDDLQPVEDLFEEVLEEGDDYIEVPPASAAIAAAEALAALRGKPARELPDELKDWLKERKKPPKAALVKQAVRILKRILKDSELKDVWFEAEDREAWQRGVEDLLERLEA
jgi:hypothetical protein